MFDQIVNSIIQCITAVTAWMTKIFNAIPGALGFVIGFFVVFLSYRFLLAPLVRGDGFRHFGASDRASRSLPSGSSDEAG